MRGGICAARTACGKNGLLTSGERAALGHLLDGLRNRKLLSITGVDTSLTFGGWQDGAISRPHGRAAERELRLLMRRFLLLVAVAAVLISVFSLSTASRTDLGFWAGAHLRSLARAHRVADGDGPTIQVEHAAVRPVTVLAEPELLGWFLPHRNGARKPYTSFAGSRISRAPPAVAA